MRQFIVDDRIANRIKKFYTIEDAKMEAKKTIEIYIKLNRRVKCKQKDCNFYIYLDKEE
jgi:hypothetical protein